IKHILQQHTGALHWRQADHKMFQRIAGIKGTWVGELGRLGTRNCGFGLDSYSALPQKINAAIMRDAEQPGLQWPTVVEFVQLAVSLEQRLLYNIFAVHHGTRHASTVAVQAWTKRGKRLQKSLIALFEGTDAIENLIISHGVHQTSWRTLSQTIFHLEMLGSCFSTSLKIKRSPSNSNGRIWRDPTYAGSLATSGIWTICFCTTSIS